MKKYIKEDDILMDFSCGGCYLLSNFKNKNKIVFEINKSAWKECIKNNIFVCDNFDDIKDESVDTIISNHAIEHVPLPLETLKKLYSKLKTGGKIVIVLPCEQPYEAGFFYKDNNINQHLHTWTPMTFGNLVKLAGFKIIDSSIFQHQSTPNYLAEYKDKDYHYKCIAYAKQNRNIQIRLIGTK